MDKNEKRYQIPNVNDNNFFYFAQFHNFHQEALSLHHYQVARGTSGNCHACHTCFTTRFPRVLVFDNGVSMQLSLQKAETMQIKIVDKQDSGSYNNRKPGPVYEDHKILVNSHILYNSLLIQLITEFNRVI